MWVNALRSGDYKQSAGALRIEYPNRKIPDRFKFCCLGVACAVYTQETDKKFRWVANDLCWGEDNIEGERLMGVLRKGEAHLILPQQVANWLGIEMDPVLGEDDLGRDIQASGANDDLHWTFKRIARAVEKRYLTDDEEEVVAVEYFTPSSNV